MIQYPSDVASTTTDEMSVVVAEFSKQTGRRGRAHATRNSDLLVVAGGRTRGFEIKLTDAPGVTPSMRAAVADLRLDSLDVVCASKDTYALAPRVRAVPLSRLSLDVAPLEAGELAGTDEHARKPGEPIL